ncbi:F390 synthetase-related protein [Micropruina sp.]|uniref:F390 synthetase-related protein n=1 Tax=Micropruina sp. TaxID=2737536 RepID=UPI0039E4B487
MAEQLQVDRWQVLRSVLGTWLRRFGTRDALDRYQRRRLRKALGRARRVFPYYADIESVELDAFPVLDKAEWLEHFDGLNDRGLSLDDCLVAAREAEARRSFDATLAGVSVGLSSGTSGRQGVFLTSPAERARWAGTVLAKALPSLREPARVALVLRSGGPLYQAVDGGRIAFRYVDLALDPDVIAAQLTDFAPTVLAAPPQVLDDLAGRSSVGSGQLRPQVVYSIADVLDDDVAARVEAGFGVRLRQVYQATEGFLGISCAHGTLHLNEDLVHVEREVIDEASGRFVPIITDLYRTSQAIIRYRLGDVLVPGAANCPCGSVFTAIDRIEGRADDVLQFTAATGETRPLFADFVRAAVLGAPAVADFRLVQRADGSLRLAVRPERAQASAHLALQALLRSRGLRVPQIFGMPWPVEAPTAKRRRVRRDG